MKVFALVENTSNNNNIGAEHGLSLYIETENNKILFDTGQTAMFYKNADFLGVDLKKVDICVISHGHNDHGGGLKTFLEINPKAKIYINEKAFYKYYAKNQAGELIDIGLDDSVLKSGRIIFTGPHYRINDELELFSNIKGQKFIPSGNKSFLMKLKNMTIEDNFEHEQNLIIKKGGKCLLLAGCSHRGIINIIDHIENSLNLEADYVIGGFHLYNPSNNKSEDEHTVKKIAEYLLKSKSVYYTCHCTGIESFKVLKEIMGDKIQYLSGGDEIII